MQQVELPPVLIPQKVQVTQRNQQNLSNKSNLQKDIIQHDIEMVEDEIKKQKRFLDSLQEVVKKVHVSKTESSINVDQLNKQSMQLENQIQTYQKTLEKSSQKQIQKSIQANKKLYIAKWEERISIAQELNIKIFQQIDIDDKKSIAHQLFKWIIVAIYHQPEVKYYFPNFKTQLFQKDDGKDFRQRLGKINAANAKQQEIIKLKDFIQKFNDILQAQELIQLKDLPRQAQKLRKIAQIFIECNELAKKTLELEKSIESDKQSSLKKDEQAMKWKAKHEAVQERLQVVKQYLQTLNLVQKEFSQKSDACSKRIQMGKRFFQNLKKGIQIDESQMEKYASL